MISNLIKTSKDLYVSNQIRFRLIFLPLDLGTTSLHIRDFYYLVNTLTNKADICIKEKF